MGFSLKKLLNPKSALKRDMALFHPTSAKDLNPLGKVMSDGRTTIGAPAAPVTGGNPYAQYTNTPGIGYTTGPNGANPFAGVASQIPAGFFQSSQAQAALMQMLGGQGGGAPAPGPNVPPPSINTPGLAGGNPWAQIIGRAGMPPGPPPAQSTMMGRVGGFGNGGGKMILGNKSPIRAK
jgi:hypothetical protein